jgi:hypothetical protein
MADNWLKIPLDSKVLAKVSDTVLQNRVARLENAYVVSEEDTKKYKAIARFPHLEPWITLPIKNKVFLSEWLDDQVAVCGGRMYRLDNSGNITDVTGASVTGGGRPVFSETEDEKLVAAGGAIISLKGNQTKILSGDAPESTHVFYTAGYVGAIEMGVGRFRVTSPGQYDVWNQLDTFSAEGKPDKLNAAIVTEFGELLLCGPKSIEQFDAAPSGQRPFFKRWGIGAGLYAPYAVTSVGAATWLVNDSLEFVSVGGQAARPESDDVQYTLSRIDDWKDAWADNITVDDQRFIILQAPYATNTYGTKGVTFLFDYLKRRWSSLYGWDSQKGLPAKWPGWSVNLHRGEVFIGGDNGIIYRLGGYGTQDSTNLERMLIRTGHMDFDGSVETRIDKIRMRLKRGDEANSNDPRPLISIRVNKDNKGFGNWVRRDLGAPGEREMVIQFGAFGTARTWQFEVAITDRCPVEIVKAEADVTPMRM